MSNSKTNHFALVITTHYDERNYIQKPIFSGCCDDLNVIYVEEVVPNTLEKTTQCVFSLREDAALMNIRWYIGLTSVL